MSLSQYGWNEGWTERLQDSDVPDGNPARVVAEHRGLFEIHTGITELPARVSGRLRHRAASRADFPAVGDWVVVDLIDDGAAARIHVGADLLESEILLRVRDEGIGIAPQHHDSIFEIFRRAPGAPGEGRGVGLAICKRIVERHGGRIWVDSEPGKGSTFYLTLRA